MYHVRAYSHRCEFCSTQDYFGEHYLLMAFLVGAWWHIKGYAVVVEKVL